MLMNADSITARCCSRRRSIAAIWSSICVLVLLRFFCCVLARSDTLSRYDVIFAENPVVPVWKNAATSARGPLGALASRTFNAAQATHDLPGVPHGDYIVLVYDGAFANRNVREIITPMREADGSWKVAGYVIQ